MDPRWIRLVLGDHVGRRSESDGSIRLWAPLLQKAVFHLRGHHTTRVRFCLLRLSYF